MTNKLELAVKEILKLTPKEFHQDYDGTNENRLLRYQSRIIEDCSEDEAFFLLDFFKSMRKHNEALNMKISTRVNNLEKAIYIMTDKRLAHPERKPFIQWNETDVENFVYRISELVKTNGKPLTMGYKNKLKLTCKYLLTFARYGDGWYKVQMDKTYDNITRLLKWKTPDAERKIKSKNEFLTEKELYDIFERVGNLNHQAYFEMLYQSGARPREISKLRVGDITKLDQKDMFSIRIYNTKTTSGSRNVIFHAPKYVGTWLSYHQRMNDPDALLFPKKVQGNMFDYNKTLDSSTYTNLLKKGAIRCGINKHITAYLLRKCNTTHLYQKGMKPEEIKRRNGWVAHSKEFDTTYNYVFDEEVDNSYMRAKNLTSVAPEPTNNIVPNITPELFAEFMQFVQNKRGY